MSVRITLVMTKHGLHVKRLSAYLHLLHSRRSNLRRVLLPDALQDGGGGRWRVVARALNVLQPLAQDHVLVL